MKNIFFLFAILLLLSSCSKELNLSESSNLNGFLIEKEVNPRTLYTISQNEHEKVAAIFSKMMNNQTFRDLLFVEINQSRVSDYYCVSIMEILSGSNASFFKSLYNSASNDLLISDFNFDYFIQFYLRNHPGMGISIYEPDISNINTISPIESAIPLFSNYLDEEYNKYVVFSNGTNQIPLNGSEDPAFKIAVIQDNEGYVVLDENRISNPEYFDNYSRVRYCDNLVNSVLGSLSFNSAKGQRLLSIGGKEYLNPFEGYLFISDSEITDAYHNLCTQNPPLSPPVPPGNGCIAERTTFNNSVNREEVTQFKMPDGKLTLDLNGKWCKWSKKKCRLQLDLFVPTRYNSSTYTVGAPGPYFCWVKRKDLKDKKITPPDNPLITVPWQYERTMHGDEWKYLWHGKHHKDGDEITTTVSSTVTSSVKFKEEDGTETTLTPSNTISTQIKTKLIDVPLGGTWTYFCDPITVNNFKGTRYYLGLMDFYVREAN